ncbi:19989_t:CDS:2 [Funneliformis geosporum]|uniref:19989_t:CDS:1 n=1 Tax=Funneliformis geosporum TaxID=1117311 RepID=A0A9W4SFN3_9GLOM|nr:19989_t:CDS:2 [Funneliformis geosporum]
MLLVASRMKVSNLLSANVWQLEILTSTISERTETESFLGTYVFPLTKRLKNKRPSIRHNNISEEKGLYANVLEYLYHAKQNALKVYMNSFYGIAEDSKFPFFLRELAGGVTFTRQRNIKLVADFECDKAYDSGNRISKEEYWSKMVEISVKVIEKLRDDVNDFLRKDNGSLYLKMAYKEVLFLVTFTGKKKYYGILHVKGPNFNNKLFIQVVEDVLKETVRDISQTDLNEIIKTAIDIPMKRHAKQLIKKGLTSKPYLYEIPESDEQFEYVVVENDLLQKVDDKMEYPEVTPAIIRNCAGNLKKAKRW